MTFMLKVSYIHFTEDSRTKGNCVSFGSAVLKNYAYNMSKRREIAETCTSRKKRRSLQSSLQEAVVNMYRQLKAEAEEEDVCLTKGALMKRIAVLVGHSYSAVERIIAKYEKGHPLSTPGKHKKRPRCVTGIDDFSKEAIARFIYDRLNRGERVTAKLVLDHVMENHGSATHSWSKPAIVGGKVQGVMRRPAEGGRLVIVHAGTYNGFIPDADLIFASNLKTGQDYHGAMNSETFQKWVERQLIVGLRDVGPSIIVMDNASYHNKAAEEQPTTKWRKDQLMVNIISIQSFALSVMRR
ncbi:uncharacterized protein [Periplaneta americana]|uniref:uncharacterized protein isoform X2 n=1 Tax=Periplaneta americana TaxID=6978 RepID=UPI0037E8E5C5